MDEYAEEKRTEKNLIVRSGIAYLKPKQLIIKDCARCFVLKSAIQTRSIARPLCDMQLSFLLVIMHGESKRVRHIMKLVHWPLIYIFIHYGSTAGKKLIKIEQLN